MAAAVGPCKYESPDEILLLKVSTSYLQYSDWSAWLGQIPLYGSTVLVLVDSSVAPSSNADACIPRHGYQIGVVNSAMHTSLVTSH